MEKRNTDVNLNDIIDYLDGYKPEIQLPMFKVKKFCEDFKINEDGETTITGTKKDWVSLMVLIVECYYKPYYF